MGAFGQETNQKVIDDLFLESPGEFLVRKCLKQMQLVDGFTQLFGPYKDDSDDMRWADYQRMDWSIRMLPAINVFNAITEDKSSDNGWLNGTIQFQAFWAPSMRRRQLSRVPLAFKGVLQNFFSSQYVRDMLDELYYVERDSKVPGLNEFGKMMSWSPNTEGIVESELVPVTIVDVRYRIDLRAWYRHLEFTCRTKDEPFKKTLDPLLGTLGTITGLDDEDVPQVSIDAKFNVSNP